MTANKKIVLITITPRQTIDSPCEMLANTIETALCTCPSKLVADVVSLITPVPSFVRQKGPTFRGFLSHRNCVALCDRVCHGRGGPPAATCPLLDQGVTLPVRYEWNSTAKPPSRLCPRQHLWADPRRPA